MTKVQKKKARARAERSRSAFLASLTAPIITVNSPALEQLFRPRSEVRHA
jgi:hypothetical protein